VNCRHFISILSCALLAVLLPLQAEGKPTFALQDGDIVFSGSAEGQGAAITAATGSPITHCGIVFKKDGRWMVLEAVQPVSVTTFENFITRVKEGTFAVRRLKTAATPESYQKASKWAAVQMGRDYDVRFAWDDKKLYCSELVWKFYQQAGIELCPLKKYHDYDLEQPLVKKMIERRYGSMDKLPMGEKIVAPSDLLASTLLLDVPQIKK
jgi:hypothetical protein